MGNEWMVYQIGSNTPNVYRFIVIQEGNAADAVVEADLQEGEYIDTTTTLSGHLNGEAKVITG